MTSDRRLLGAALGLALIVAACGGSSATPSPTAAAAASEAPAASTEASMPDISLTPGGASALEGTLPSSAGDVTFTKTSFDGASIPGAGLPFDSSNIDPTLSKYGKTIADVKIAIAASSSGTPTIYALQLQGVPATQFMSDAGIDTTGMTQSTISGKSVWVMSGGGMSEVVYPKDDVTYLILFGTDAQNQAILAALP
jgi:hypothetical protein